MTQQIATTKPEWKQPGKYHFRPLAPEKGEQINGGFCVIRRGDKTGRLRPSSWPMEFATEQAATDEANRLAMKHPGQLFAVWRQVSAVVALGD
jgi:hypothetical protein